MWSSCYMVNLIQWSINAVSPKPTGLMRCNFALKGSVLKRCSLATYPKAHSTMARPDAGKLFYWTKSCVS